MKTLTLKQPTLFSFKKSKAKKNNKSISSTYQYDVIEHLRSSEGHVLGFAVFTK